MVFPWLIEDLRRLTADRTQVAHAVLLHGQSGIGKRRLGQAVARGLLCESADPAATAIGGCGRCAACLWFDQGNHPDFRKVIPEALAVAEGAELAEDAGDVDGAAEVGAAPRAKRVPSKEVRIDQIRALQSFMSIATHRANFRVVLLYPVETVNDVAANALLKMLEEPPARTVFLLIADHLGRIPATILSRCRKISVATPADEIAADWLRQQGVDDAKAMLALSGGAPLSAAQFAADPQTVAAHREFVAFLERPGVEAALATAESFGRTPTAPLVRWLQLWMSDCMAMRLAGRIRYHPAQSGAIARLVAAVPIDALVDLMQRVDSTRRTIDHPLNGRLLLESLLCAYADAMTPVKP